MVYRAIEILESIKETKTDETSKNEIDFAIKVLENLEDSLDAKSQRNRASLFDF